jgi:hypothetical protein
VTDHQKYVVELAAKILSGVLSGRMAANANMDMGNIRPHQVQGSLRIAMALVEEARNIVPAEPPPREG